MKTVEPSPSYSICVPADAHEEYDGGVLSLWRDGDATALQFSSFIREAGTTQVSAAERLAERIQSTGGEWKRFDVRTQCECDIAAATTERNGFRWQHIYVVTPRVAVYATISHPSGQTAGNWASEAVRGIRFRH